MGVVLARVDSRLVHGQVLEGWVPRLKAEAILVVDRELVSDPFQRTLLESLGRPGLEVRLVTPGRAAELLGGALAGRRVLVLFAGVGQAVEARKAGVVFDGLNLGNVHPRPQSRALTTSVYLTAEDVALLDDLMRGGVRLEARAVPADRSPDLAAWVRCRGGP